jgi:hypothetical protein
MGHITLNRILKSASSLLGIACIFAATICCTHQPAAAPVPNAPPPAQENTSRATEKLAVQPDQVNTTGWDRAWTNLTNVVEQSFTPSLARLGAVEVELVVGNPGPREDELTLTLLDAQDHMLAVVAQRVSTENPDHVLFNLPAGGVPVSPGELYRIRLSGGPTFGWKYIVGGYAYGAATFNGKPLLAQERSTFLFRTFAAK